MAYHIANLLEKMTSADKDYRFMATNDLMSELQKDSIKLDDDSEKKVVKMLLKLLEDKNGEVQNLAVKCLGPLVNKVKENQVETIVDTLCSNMLSENEQLRDSSSMALKTVIAQLPPSSSLLTANVTRRVMPRLTAAVAAGEPSTTQQSDVSVRLEILEIIADILYRYGSLLTQYHQQVEEVLLPQLSSSRLAIRKRAIGALAYLVAACNTQLFDHTIGFLVENLAADASVSTSRTYVMAVTSVSRAVPHSRFGSYLATIVPLMIDFSNKKDDDELREAVLHAFEAFIYRCPRDVEPFLDDMVSLCSQYLSHDPNYHYDDDDDTMNGDMDVDGNSVPSDDEDEDEYSDDDDMSWKVRRAAAKCIEAVIGARRDRVQQMLASTGPLLINRFKEREDNVKADIFQAYICLLQQATLLLPAVHMKRQAQLADDGGLSSYEATKARFVETQASLTDEQKLLVDTIYKQMPLVVRGVCRQLRGTSSARTRACCLHVLCCVMRVQPDSFSEQIKTLLPATTSLVLADANKHCPGNIKIDVLAFLGQAFATHEPKVFAPYLDVLVKLICQCTRDSFYKVAAEALSVVRPFVGVLRPSVTKPVTADVTKHARTLYDAVFDKLKATDIDQEVKEKCIGACGLLVANLGDALSGQLSACLLLLMDRLRNEMTRLHTVKAFVGIANSPLRVDLSPVLPDLVALEADFLRKNQRALKISSLHLLHALLEHYGTQITDAQLNAAVAELPALVSDADLQISQLVLRFFTDVVTHPARSSCLLANSAAQEQLLGSQPVGSLIALCQSAMLQGSTLQQTLDLLKAITKANAVHNKRSAFAVSCRKKPLYQSLTSSVYAAGTAGSSTGLHRHAYLSIAKCVAAVASESTAEERVQLAKQLAQQIETGLAASTCSTDGLLLFSLLCAGEMGRYSDDVFVKAGIKPEQLMVAAFQSSSEDIKTAASYSLGALCAGNLSTYVPFLLREIDTQSKRQYLLLHALKEVIGSESVDQHAIDIFKPRIDDIWRVLLAHAACAEEGTRNVVAECLGKLCLMDPVRLLPKLKSSLSSDVHVRATCVTSVKYMLHDDAAAALDQLLASHIPAFLAAIRDDDLNVRRTALITFNSAVHNKPQLVRSLLDDLLPSLYEETKVRKELVREVEMGPFKHTVDDGLDLRKAAFECMYTLLDTCMERLEIFEFLNHVEDGLKDQHDIKLLTYLMLCRLCVHCPGQVSQRMDKLVEPLKTTLQSKSKANAVKQEIEKLEEIKRSAMRAVLALSRMPDSGRHQPLTELLSMIKQNNELHCIYTAMERDTSGRMFSGGIGDAMDTN